MCERNSQRPPSPASMLSSHGSPRPHRRWQSSGPPAGIPTASGSSPEVLPEEGSHTCGKVFLLNRVPMYLSIPPSNNVKSPQVLFCVFFRHLCTRNSGLQSTNTFCEVIWVLQVWEGLTINGRHDVVRRRGLWKRRVAFVINLGISPLPGLPVNLFQPLQNQNRGKMLELPVSDIFLL